MSRLRLFAALPIAFALLLATAPPAASAYSFNAYWSSGSGGTFVNQPDPCTCVAASAQAWLNKLNGTQYQSGSIVWQRFAWARPYTQYICRLYNATGSVIRSGVPTASYGRYNPYAAGHTRYVYSRYNPGLDPRGFAWILYEFSAPGYHFNDYWLNAGNDGSLARAQLDLDASIVKNLRITRRPVGAIIHGGNHAILVTGFLSDYDPLSYNYRLLGFYAWDPYSNVLGRNYGTGYLGQTFFTLSNWKANQFTPYHDYQYTRDTGRYAIWERDPRSGGPSYVAVFQTSDTSTTNPGVPTDSPPNSIGFARWRGGSPVVAVVGSADAGSASPSAGVSATSSAEGESAGVGRGEIMSEVATPGHAGGDVAAAVRQDLAAMGLTGSSPLGDLKGAQVAHRLHVRSATPSHSSYWLVSLDKGGHTVAVATVDETPAGLRLGSITATGAGYRFPDGTRVRAALSASGSNAVHLEATYLETTEYAPELAPVWSVTEADGRITIRTEQGALIGANLP